MHALHDSPRDQEIGSARAHPQAAAVCKIPVGDGKLLGGARTQYWLTNPMNPEPYINPKPSPRAFMKAETIK